MHHRHVADIRVHRERLVQGQQVNGTILGGLDDQMCQAEALADYRHAFSIGAIDEDQKLTVPGHEGADHRFHGECAAALHRHALVAVMTVHQSQQTFADALCERDEFPVPGAEIPQHGALHRHGGGQGAGGQQPGIAVLIVGRVPA